MLRAARIVDLFFLVLSTAGALSAAFKSSSATELVGVVLAQVVLLPLWLALFSIGSLRPRIEKAALVSNYILAFLLASGFVAVVMGQSAFFWLPVIVILFAASALNIVALKRQTKGRAIGASVDSIPKK